MKYRRLVALVLAVGALLVAVPANADASSPCKPQTSTLVGLSQRVAPAAGQEPELKPIVTLSSSGPAEPINMGGLRDAGSTDIAIAASPALPSSVTAEELTVDIPKRFARTGSGLTSQYLPPPEFTKPRILQHGTLIVFTLCLDASHADAGSYLGQVVVGGPKGVQPATVAVTLNAKDEERFIIGIVLAGIIAFVLLVFHGVKARIPAGAQGNKSIGTTLGATVKDFFGFWVPTIVALAAAIIAMFQVYNSSVSWGADTASSLIALGGTAISAAGLGTFLSSLKGT